MLLDDRIEDMERGVLESEDHGMAADMVALGRAYCGVLYEEKTGGNSHIEYVLELFKMDRKKAKSLFTSYEKALDCVKRGVGALEKFRNCNPHIVSQETLALNLFDAGNCYRHAASCTNTDSKDFGHRFEEAMDYYSKAQSLSFEGSDLHESCTTLLKNTPQERALRAKFGGG
jgi:hypothetical protein